MNRVRLAVSIISLVVVLGFGATLTFGVAQASARIPECECDMPNYSGLTCDYNGQRSPWGLYCCRMECYIIVE